MGFRFNELRTQTLLERQQIFADAAPSPDSIFDAEPGFWRPSGTSGYVLIVAIVFRFRDEKCVKKIHSSHAGMSLEGSARGLECLLTNSRVSNFAKM